MSWSEEIENLRQNMEAKHLAREKALQANRQIIQISSKAIKLIHRKDYQSASNLIDEAKSVAQQARAHAADHPDVLYAGYLQDAEKELVEACGCLAVAQATAMPTADQLGVDARSYLNGMGECASEMRRTVLDLMRSGQMDEAERIHQVMEEIYDDLSTFDFPDGLTGGLRRTCDALRAVIERTRSDLTLTKIQEGLIQELRESRKS